MCNKWMQLLTEPVSFVGQKRAMYHKHKIYNQIADYKISRVKKILVWKKNFNTIFRKHHKKTQNAIQQSVKKVINTSQSKYGDD